jgi:hypothetical protein
MEKALCFKGVTSSVQNIKAKRCQHDNWKTTDAHQENLLQTHNEAIHTVNIYQI